MPRKLLEKLDKPWITALLVGLFFVGFLGAYCAKRHDFQASQFVCAGIRYCDPAHTPSNLVIYPHDGFDGQFFYRLALNPFTRQKTEYGITLDTPPYRQQRIFYPLLAFLLDLGNPMRAPRSLLLLNLLSIVGIAYLAALRAQERRLHALWGILAGLNPGAFFTLQRDTSELVSLFLALLALHLTQRGKYVASAGLLVCAMLTRETTLVVAGAIAIGLLTPRLAVLRQVATVFTAKPEEKAKTEPPPQEDADTRSDARRGWMWALTPFAAYLLWQALLTHLWGVTAGSASGGRLTLPFVGMWELFASGGGSNGLPALPTTVCQIFLVVYTFLLTIGELRQSTVTFAEKIAWCVYALMSISYTYMIYIQDYSFMRVMVDYFAFSGFILYGARRKARWQLLLVVLAVNAVQVNAFLLHR